MRKRRNKVNPPRADLAANFQSWASKPDQGVDVFETLGIPAEEDMITVPAAPDESAVVTMHRMERTGASTVVLVTVSQVDDRHTAIPFHLAGRKYDESIASSGVPELPVEPGMTVAEWVRGIQSVGGKAHTMNSDSKFFAYLSEQMNYDVSS